MKPVNPLGRFNFFIRLLNAVTLLITFIRLGSHLMGMFYRTVRMLDSGLKPVYVFEGKPPNLKSGELAKRTDRREENAKELSRAEELGDAEAIDKYSRRLVKVTPQHNDDCKQLLRLMGIPVVEVLFSFYQVGFMCQNEVNEIFRPLAKQKPNAQL